MHVLVESALDRLDLSLAVVIGGVFLGPEAAKGSEGIIFAVFGQEPTGGVRDEEAKRSNDYESSVSDIAYLASRGLPDRVDTYG